MKSKMKKKLIAFMLCMVLVICNSVSILADTPAPETKTTQQVKETKTVKEEKASEESKTAAKDSGTSEQSEEEEAPEVKTTEKKEETTKATTESTKATTETAEETTTEVKEDKTEATTEAAEETSTTEGKEEASDTSEEDKKENKEATTTEGKEETAPAELTYTNDDVIVTVSEVEEGAIPEGAELKVVPILKNDAETKEQYAEVEKQIQEKAAETETEIKGFLAYDITFMDKDGNEIEPNSEVKVSMEYKQAAIPEEITAEDAKDTEVSVIHLEEDTDGNVAEVVDMRKAGKVDTLETTDENKVEKVEVKTKSFSVYTITWYNYYNGSEKIKLKYVDSSGTEIKGNEGEGHFNSNEWINLTSEEYQVNIDGYEYSKTYFAKEFDNIPTDAKNSNITNIKAQYHYYPYSLQGYWTYKYKNGNNSLEHDFDSDNTIYFIYNKVTTVDPDPGTPEDPELKPLGTPDHNKYIDYHEKTDDYTLTLDVEGKVGEALPIDILLIVDSSGSMKEDNGYKTDRYKNVNAAINTLKTTLLEQKQTNPDLEDVKINLGVVTFSAEGAGTDEVRNSDTAHNDGDTKKDSTIAQNWTALESFNWTLDKDDCDGGTNWQAGIREGENLLSQKENTDTYTSRKYVIFLTDGEPTYRYLENSDTITQGTGNSDTNSNNYKYASNEWSSSNTLKTANGRYVIDATAYGSDNCYKFATEVMGGSRLMGNNSSDMTEAFSKIAQEITKPVYKNVSITDTLSEYAELTSTPEFTVSAVNTETQMSVNLNATDYEITVYDENETSIYSGSDPNAAAGVNWTQGRKVKLTLNLPNNQDNTQSGILEDNIKYSISFNIKATGTAKEEFATQKQYPDVGDSETDAVGNYTSSEQEGFYSNDNENTFLTYQENNNAAKDVKYPKPVIQVKDNLEPVNFYLNLSSQIMDSSGNISSRDKGDFTTCVSGPQSAVESDHGIGEAINEHLFVELPENHEHPSSGEMGVIGSQDDQNAVIVDGNIRDLEEGTTGTENGHSNLTYKIVDTTTGDGAFPDDGDIFEYIRENWGSETSAEGENAKNVNKGKNITVNGVAIDKENLTEDNFLIRWYVFKDNAGDYWHIDGVLVPKSGILKVTKTFPNETIAESVKNTFAIQVEGNFLVGNNVNSTITKTLKEAAKNNNEDGSVTYTWTLAIFGEQYTVSERGYETNSSEQWIYSNTDCSYIDINGDSSNPRISNKNGVISTTIQTDRNWVDQVGQASQTLAFTNNYTLKTVNLDLVKTSINSNKPINGAVFKLSKKSEGAWSVVNDNIEVLSSSDSPELTGLVTNEIYMLEEIEAPAAHVLLGEPIYFKVENGVVKLCNEAGNTSGGTNEMWSLNNGVLTIKNNILYSLPSAGGSGIYWYTLSGALLMMGAALIVYKQQRKREVLLKK